MLYVQACDQGLPSFCRHLARFFIGAVLRYLLIGDIHLSDKPPSSCNEEYTEDILTILEHTVQLESDLKVDGVIWSGDVFHIRQANRNSHKLVQRAIDIVQAYRNLWIVPGNHDLAPGDRQESVFETQPLGVLFKAGAKLLDGWEETGRHPIFGVPWQQKWDRKTVEKLFGNWNAEHPLQKEMDYGRLPPIFTEKALVVAHAPLYPPGKELEWEFYPAQEWAEIQDVGYCYYGHVHDYHGEFEVGGVTFCNQGAITRGSLQESDLTRAIAVTLWSPDTGFQRVDVPHKPSSEVFRLMEKRAEQEKKLELEEFLVSIGTATIEITSTESVIEYLKTLDLPEDVIKLAIELLGG